MIIECDTCVVRNISCGDCVITAILGSTAGEVEFDAVEQRAIGALAGVGLLPPLRLVPALSGLSHVIDSTISVDTVRNRVG